MATFCLKSYKHRIYKIHNFQNNLINLINDNNKTQEYKQMDEGYIPRYQPSLYLHDTNTKDIIFLF